MLLQDTGALQVGRTLTLTLFRLDGAMQSLLQCCDEVMTSTPICHGAVRCFDISRVPYSEH